MKRLPVLVHSFSVMPTFRQTISGRRLCALVLASLRSCVQVLFSLRSCAQVRGNGEKSFFWPGLSGRLSDYHSFYRPSNHRATTSWLQPLYELRYRGFLRTIATSAHKL